MVFHAFQLVQVQRIALGRLSTKTNGFGRAHILTYAATHALFQIDNRLLTVFIHADGKEVTGVICTDATPVTRIIHLGDIT